MYGLLQIQQLYPEMWNNITLPNNLKPFQTEIINTIMGRCAVLQPFPGDPNLFVQKMWNWFKINAENFGKMYDALMSEYNPIENYDRKEAGSSDSTYNPGSEVENKISAMNSDGYQNDNKTINSGEDRNHNNYESRIHGNIGVTTTQQMIQSELELRKFNLFEYIAQLFETDLCLGVY